MRVVLLAPFYTESHRQWADGLIQHSRHDIALFTMPGRHWKWRMHGAAVTLSDKVNQLDYIPDLIIASDMLDLAAFRGLLSPDKSSVPCLLYMHENQLTYPWSPTDGDVSLQRDRHYSWINYTSMLAADRIAFNSGYHRRSVLEALPDYLMAYPDYQHQGKVAYIRQKSTILYLGMDFKQLERDHKPNTKPVLLWNHRWEYDKGPEEWCTVISALAQRFDFDVIICGKPYRKYPTAFDRIRQDLGDRLIHWGYADTASSYTALLEKADILPVTSRQDFFGISVVEAMNYGCMPLLPKRLAYTDYVDPSTYPNLYYKDLGGALSEVLQNWPQSYVNASALVRHFDWPQAIEAYDAMISELG